MKLRKDWRRQNKNCVFLKKIRIKGHIRTMTIFTNLNNVLIINGITEQRTQI